MARKIIDTGVVGNDGTGDSIRDSFRKVNDNFRELYSSLGLGEKLQFIKLDDVRPDRSSAPYGEGAGYLSHENAILSVNPDESGIKFKQLVNGSGIQLDFTTNSNEIRISSQFSEVVGDPSPQLGGDLSAKSGGEQWRIKDLGTTAIPIAPIYEHEAVNKRYADSKISRAGVDAIDPRTNIKNPSFGTMSGPLILSRDPQPDDDETYDGLIAASKRYVDNSAFGSSVNLYVATSGEDDRVGVSSALQGRALAYAYRSVEAALKKAEELVLDARNEIGPYKKVLTYNNGASQCTLSDIETAPGSGAGFSGIPLMSIDVATINIVGVNYRPGDILTVLGGTYIQPARFEVLSITEAGGVITFRQLSSGVYTALPGSTSISCSDNSNFGNGVTFNFTYKVNNVQVSNGGSGYGLVSVRIIGGGGAGAFGTADVSGGVVVSITITDQGSGFTSLPLVEVSLPRFLITTNGYRTDFTGDVTTSTPFAIRSRDIREGLYIRGESSGALAQILSHQGALDSLGNEIFDVDLKYGTFEIGEVLSYGDVTKNIQITVLVESGIYEENLPLKIPSNVSIVGDEFRRCIIRPKPGLSSSAWAFTYFRRDLTVGVSGTDLLSIADRLFGYHYLQNSAEPIYPLVNNRGYYRSAAQLLTLNRSFIQKEVVSWIANQVENAVSPFTTNFIYNEKLCERDVGLIIDSMVFDLKWGGSNRTISAALKYYGNASGLIAIGASQLTQTIAAIRRLGVLAQLVIRNVTIQESYQTIYPQIVDGAYIAETGTSGTSFNITGATKANPIAITTGTAHGLVDGDQIIISNVGGMTEINGNDYYVDVIDANSFYLYNNLALSSTVNSTSFTTYTSGGSATNTGGVVGALINAVIDVIDNSGSVNYPKDNDQMDVMLCNDAVRIQSITFQGHGGFAMVLDPEGQILAKSPYAQECASFSKGTGQQTFAGGQYVDGFAGNLKFKIISKDSNTFLRVGELKRMPQLPASFIVEDTVYRINYVRDYTFSTAGSTASFVLDETTPWPYALFTYNQAICYRDVGLILDGVGYDIVLGTNYHSRRSGFAYRQVSANVVIQTQLDLTVQALEQAHDFAANYVSTNSTAQALITTSKTVIANITRNGTTFAPGLTFTLPPSLASNRTNAYNLLVANNVYIQDQTVGWIAAQVSGNIAPFTTAFTYNATTCARDIGYIVEAVIYDIIYGGNSESRKAGIKYYDGVGSAIVSQLPAGQVAPTVAAINYAKYLAKQVILNSAPAASYSATTRTPGTASDAAIQAVIETLMTNIGTTITNTGVAPAAEVLPDLNAYAYSTTLKASRTTIVTNKTNIQQAVIDFINENANVYEVLMPGNRSMLSNDYTQINDLGYGIVVNNGGLAECVSMFTYYCHISYYSMGGGQIRSIGGSSAHGNFALVAEGSDPLEVPTPVSLYYDLAQVASCYAPTGSFATAVGGLAVYVNNYTHPPLPNGELEVDHGLGSIYRYPITGVNTSGLPAGVARLSLRSSEGAGVDGLAAVIPNGTTLTIRQNSNVVLTGNAVDVAVRPSTGLVLAESDEVYRVLQFEAYADFVGARTFTVNIASPAVITRVSHGLQPGYQITLSTTGALPTGLVAGEIYYVQSDGFTANSFSVSTAKRGTAITTTGSQSGTHSYIVYGLAQTTLRENYNYIDFTVEPLQPFLTSASVCTITLANPGVVSLASHGFLAGNVVRFTTTGTLPVGLSITRLYFVKTVLTPGTFTITDVATTSSVAIETTTSQSGTHRVGKVSGSAGDSTFAVVPISGPEESRVIGHKIVFKGTVYTVQGYQNATITGQAYGLLTVSPALTQSVVYWTNLPTLKAATLKDETGTLTIRISLTRVTSHDLLEIGTGSYADTNYPNEIYGASVNALDPDSETQERSVGRVFYVTTDQFGNFSVGPYFRVDQGTGSVTFAASIALSNLDGIGFKRGVPVSEFSTDSSMADNATDTVPTENAVRGYLERRLGTSHTGATITAASLIPAFSGGFLSLDGQLAMKANLDAGGFKVANLANPTNPTDAVNLRSLTIDNLSDVSITNPRSADILTFTGAGNFAQNSAMIGDISLNIDSSANTVDAQINPGVITNTDINAAAAIVQSKLLMTAASTRANATSITQSDLGLASFDNAQFTATNGWLTIKDNGLTLAKLEQVPTKTVLGNSTLVAGNVTSVPFSSIADLGGAIKKSQYNSATGYLRRIGFTSTNDTDYSIVDESSTNAVSTLVKRDSNGDFGARFISIEKLLVDSKTVLDTTTSATGGYTQVYGFLSQVGILIGDGTVATDRRTYYDNDGHLFRTQNGLSYAPITVGSITTPIITTGASGTPGTITGLWTLTAGSRMQATYSADLAEYYEGDREYAVGTVLVFGGDKEVTISTTYGDYRIAGVVSDNAAYSMNSACPGLKNQIALQGRVPCRVVGQIKKGDLIITSNIPGVGISAGGNAKTGTVIGKALADYNSDHIGTIEVAVGRT
jgi:hypothetical protein